MTAAIFHLGPGAASSLCRVPGSAGGLACSPRSMRKGVGLAVWVHSVD